MLKEMSKSVIIWLVLVFLWSVFTVGKLINGSFDFSVLNIIFDLIGGPMLLVYQIALFFKEINIIKV